MYERSRVLETTTLFSKKRVVTVFENEPDRPFVILGERVNRETVSSTTLIFGSNHSDFQLGDSDLLH